MIKLKINGDDVIFDSLEEAKDAARESGLGLGFWRETLSGCAENEAMWNEFLNDLWQSGAEDEAERLDRAFPKGAPRHWLLIALTLDGDDPWQMFLAEWEAQGDERILAVVSSSAFVPWLKQVQPKKLDLLVRAFGADAAKWPSDLLLKALKAEGTTAEIAAWKAVVEKRNEPKLGDEMTITLPGGVPMTFCWCPATTSEHWKNISGGEDFFWMGSPESEAERCSDETRHRVRLTHGFWIGKYEVTKRQWEGVMWQNLSQSTWANRPVIHVAWDDCQEFIRKFNAAGQVRVSLPTEAQWEYACRAGTTTPYNFGSTLNGDKANCDGHYPYGMSSGRFRDEPSPVGEYAPNAWGLYDMHGNVWEWCADWYGEDYYGQSPTEDPTGPALGEDRVIRGGGWNSHAPGCRSAIRYWHYPSGISSNDVGLRLVCSLPCGSFAARTASSVDMQDRADEERRRFSQEVARKWRCPIV